ncbi:MAG TPA: DUF853 domain-containing protein, partial [Microbacteriaceae bacterium]|nr:DUF853 domain-containing protein [Microbacteriaceae bacterium]
MSDAAAQVEAARKALHEAEAALAAEQAAAQRAADHAAAEQAAERQTTRPASSTAPSTGPLSAAAIELVRAGYAFTGDVLEIGALVNGDALPGVQVRIPVAMLNRHGLVAGATGTGKTRTLQVLAEQLS